MEAGRTCGKSPNCMCKRSVFSVMLYFAVALIGLAEVTPLSGRASRFLNELTWMQRGREASRMSPAERADLVKELKAYARERPGAKSAVEQALAALGDRETLQMLVKTFLNSDAAGPGLLGTIQDPTVIRMVAPTLYKDEAWGVTVDVVVTPASYRVAELIAQILANSSYFERDVAEWAEKLERVMPAEVRSIMRSWWKDNEKHFTAGDYKAVRPGRQLDPEAVIPRLIPESVAE